MKDEEARGLSTLTLCESSPGAGSSEVVTRRSWRGWRPEAHMAHLVQTNVGRKSARKPKGGEPLSGLNGPDPEGGLGGESSSSLTLPPLAKSARAAEALDMVSAEWREGASPARRSRKNGLAAFGEGTARSVIQAALDCDQREKEMSLARENRQAYGRLLLEMWVNQVLDPGSGDPTGRTEPSKRDVSTLKGLAAFGLTRTELQGAGLSSEAVDRVYRSLYVYTVGFFDVMQEILEHSEFRLEVLSNVWRGFLFISEAALKVAFKSEYLQLFQAQQITAAELLVAKEALSEARQDSYNTEKALAWLTAAHAEERSLRLAIKAEVEDVQLALDRERRAHQAAVLKYVAEIEARSKAGLENERLMAKLHEAAAAHVELIGQRDSLQLQLEQLATSCSTMREDVSEMYSALSMDGSLAPPPALQQQLQQLQSQLIEAAAEAGQAAAEGDKAKLETALMSTKSSIVKDLNQQLYTRWRAETAAHAATQRELYQTRDALRVSKQDAVEAQEIRQAAEDSQEDLRRLVARADARIEDLEARLAETEATLAENQAARLLAEEEVGRLGRHTHGLERVLEVTTGERDELADMTLKQVQRIKELLSQCEGLTASLSHSNWVVQQLSKGLAVVLPALHTNQCARAVLQRKLVAARANSGSLGGLLEASNRLNRMLEGKVEQLEADCAQLQRKLDDTLQEATEHASKLSKVYSQVHTLEQQLQHSKKVIGEKTDELRALTGELDRVTRALSASESSLAQERDEVARLYAAMQALEVSLKEGAEERVRLSKKVERARAETRMAEEKFGQREGTLDSELKRLHNEVRLSRTRISGVEMQLESTRKKLDQTSDQLVRKREKKKRWKRMCLDMQGQLQFCHQQIEERDEALAVVAARLTPIEVDLAILVADRGRPVPRYKPPPATGSSPTHKGEAESSKAPEAGAGVGGGRGGVGWGEGGAPVGSVREGLYEGVEDLGSLGIRAEQLGDMAQTYTQWDSGNKQLLELQQSLDKVHQQVEDARKQYEKARAIHYTNPTDPALLERMTEREQQLQRARELRVEVSEQLEALSANQHRLLGAIHTHEAQSTIRRIEELKWRTGQREVGLRSEVLVRLEEEGARCSALQQQLVDQRTAYDMLQAAHGHLEGECKKQEQELRKLAEQLARTVAERNEVESQLRSTKGQVAFLQGELTALSRDKDSLKGQIKDHDARVVALQHELEQASSSVSNSIKRLEEKFEEEKRAALEALTKEKAGLMQQLGEQQEQVKVLTERCKQLQERTMKVLSALHGDMERSAQPMFMFAVRPSAAVKMAEQLVPGYEKITNFKLDERVAQFLAPHYEMTLTLISQLYVARILKDCKQEEFLLGGQVGPRSALEPVIYDFFCHHFGSRQATDLHLTAFLAAVLKFKGQHPKIRVFARLLGVGEEPVPRRAADFYLALLNRIHSRAGPLVAEAAEGYSQVKCRIVSKAARELLRGSFANINDDAANLSDTLRHMAMNDEEKHIDLEVSCEMTLNAWLTQFKLDADALARDLRSFAANKDLTPDDLLQFLHQLDPARAATLEPSHITSMFRSAVRAVGPTPSAAEFVQQLCEAILDAGFVGMSGYQSRLEPVKAAPPFDDFRLLDECWRGLRAVIEAQLSVLDSHRELKADVRSYIDLGKRLDLQMELRESATVAWAMYRKLVNLYLHYRKPTEQILAFVPLAQPGLLGLRPVALSEDQALAQAEEAALAAKAAAEAEADISRKPVRARAVTKTNSFGSGLTYEFNKAAVTPDTKKGGRLAPGPPPP